MKILHVSEYITIDGYLPYERNKTGFGYLVFSIAESQASFGNDITIYNNYVFSKELFYSGVRILRRSRTSFLRSLKIVDILYLLSFIWLFKPSLSEFKLAVFSSLDRSAFRKVIADGNYDFIHFHSVSVFTLPLIDLIASQGGKFCVTLHGLNSFGHLKECMVDYRIERYFLDKAILYGWNCTLISSGLKRCIEDNLNLKVDFKIILNGIIKRSPLGSTIELPRTIFESGRKVGLYLGNISNRKNQRYLIENFKFLQPEIGTNVIILFAGGDSGEFDISELISNSGFSDQLIFIGRLDRKDVDSLLQLVDFTVLLSLDEGFGLSIIEGYSYGKPALLFDDLNAIDDVYFEDATVCVPRSLQGLSDGMKRIVLNKWNSEKIIELGKKFVMSNVSKEYLTYYQDQILKYKR
jgi:glycosyltransferase involved in cell wall biosynthesis